MTERLKNAIFSVGLLALLAAAFMAGSHWPFPSRSRPVETKVDTLYVRDTLTVKTPVFFERRIIDPVTVPVVVRDTDTVAVQLPREQVVWRDTLAAVYASGVMPQVDSVRHFITERIVTIQTAAPERKAPRVSFGITAGPGILYDGRIHGGAGIVAGVQVRF